MELAKYYVVDNGVMPCGFHGFLVENQSTGKTSWKSHKKVAQLRRAGRILAKRTRTDNVGDAAIEAEKR